MVLNEFCITGTDCIELGGFQPVNLISGEDVIFLSSFHNNDVTLSQFSAMIVLLQVDAIHSPSNKYKYVVVSGIFSSNLHKIGGGGGFKYCLCSFSRVEFVSQSFIKSLIIVLPFYPVGTMERCTAEGQVATANTYATLFSNLPSCGCPTR